MGSHRSIAVYGSNATEPHLFYRVKRALELVKRGLAVVEGEQAVRLVFKPTVAPSCDRLGKSSQGKVIEKAGIETQLQWVQGGLVRTEHQPAPFSIAKAARVGHQ